MRPRPRQLVIPSAVCALLLAAGNAGAQQAIRITDISEFEAMFGEAMVVSNTPPSASTDEKEEPEKESERSKRLEKLTYDRRPSTILETWSKVQDPKPELPPDPSAEEAEVEGAEAAAPSAGETGEVAGEPAAEATPDDAEATEDETAASAGSDSDEAAETTGEEGAEASTEEAVEPTPEEAAAAKAEAKAEKARAKAEADEQKKAEKAAAEAQKEAQKAYDEAAEKLLAWELENLQRLVTLGDWAGVGAYFDELEDFEAEAAYTQILTSLVKGPVNVQGPLAVYAEKNFFAPEDLTGLAAVAPVPEKTGAVENERLDQLAKLFRSSVDEGNLLDLCLAAFRTALTDEAFPLTSAQLARVVIEAGFPVRAGEFLPTLDEAVAADQREVLNLVSRHGLALYAEEKKAAHLEHAWRATQAVLAPGEVEDEIKEEALKRAVAIAPDVREELGGAWLDESFTERPERGMEILRVIGAGSSKGLFEQARVPDKRLENLKLQTTAAEALLAAAPERAEAWSETLTILASNWLQEAVHSYQFDESTSRGPNVNRDMYGNVFYYSFMGSRNNPNIPQALSTNELLDIRPSEPWLALVEGGLRPKFEMVTAQLLLKVNEENEAFPHIEALARVHPEEATELANEFLRVWTKNHNPNSEQDRTSQFMFIYGFDARSGGIPLTRSKQERNLTELAEWVRRLRQLPLEDLDEELIATAFTSAHSNAEVYQLETLARVFGDMDALEPDTLAKLIEKMRGNLAEVWRQPDVQRDNKTQRRQKDIQAEVLRGYDVASRVASKALESHPESWALMVARAAVAHDENNYRQELGRSTEFAGRRRAALEEFARAAELYAAAAPELKLDEETIEPYLTWFYASLGATDLKFLDHEKLAARDQYPRIRAALLDLPGEASDRALASFATSLFTRMSNVNPAVKFRYVKAGLEIVGDHPRARDAREVADYYGDLVTEIQLQARVDGSAEVGHTEPFGLLVNIRHTGAIEREAGGFSKYLVNQNSNPYGFNYGRPPEDYRDKFEEATRETLTEHFDVLSVTFNHPDTHSRSTPEYGWRVTPYAYVLMKARGPEIDRVPPLRLDLDFTDTTGYAVLPAESAPVAIDAGPIDNGPIDDRTGGTAPQRPFQNLQVTQTLDERQAKDGRLLLEVKASALGLAPALDTFLDLAPEGFDVVGTEDQGVSVAEFDAEAEEPAVRSERIWMVSLRAKEGLETLPESFEFGTDRTGEGEFEYLRFVDADLESVAATVSLENRYGTPDRSRFWQLGLGALGLLGLAAVGVVMLRRRPGHREAEARFRVPESVTPFTVIGLLRDIEGNNGLSAERRAALHGDIRAIEGYYFDERGKETPDLEHIARTWVASAR